MTIVDKDTYELKLLADDIAIYTKLARDDGGDRKEFYLYKANQCQQKYDNYPKFGYAGIQYEYKEGIPRLKKLYDKRELLGEMFYRKYGRYRLGYSSYVEFQNQLQLIFDSIGDYYNDRFKVEEIYTNMFEKEVADENKGFATRTTTSLVNESTGTSKEASLPDVQVVEEETVYVGKGKQDAKVTGNVDVSDTSFLTKLASIGGYLSFDKYLIRDYLNEFNSLFQTIVW